MVKLGELLLLTDLFGINVIIYDEDRKMLNHGYVDYHESTLAEKDNILPERFKPYADAEVIKLNPTGSGGGYDIGPLDDGSDLDDLTYESPEIELEITIKI